MFVSIAVMVVFIITGSVLLKGCEKEDYESCTSTEQCTSDKNSSDYCYCIDEDDDYLCSSKCFCAYTNSISSTGFCGTSSWKKRCANHTITPIGITFVVTGVCVIFYLIILGAFWLRTFYANRGTTNKILQSYIVIAAVGSTKYTSLAQQ